MRFISQARKYRLDYFLSTTELFLLLGWVKFSVIPWKFQLPILELKSSSYTITPYSYTYAHKILPTNSLANLIGAIPSKARNTPQSWSNVCIYIYIYNENPFRITIPRYPIESQIKNLNERKLIKRDSNVARKYEPNLTLHRARTNRASNSSEQSIRI